MAIERVRKNFIIVIMSILTIMIVAVGAIIVATTFVDNARQADDVLRKTSNAYMVYFSSGDDTAQEYYLQALTKLDVARTFCVRIDENGTPIDFGTIDKEFFTTATIMDVAEKILAQKKSTGNVSGYHYLIDTENGITLLAVTDRSVEAGLAIRMVYVVLIAVFSATGLFYLIVWRLSYHFIKPIEAAFSQQKQFVSDAGHELKTPLATISANADVLQTETGESKWLSAIQSQTQRMIALVEEMLTLARTEEEVIPSIKLAEFDLARITEQTVLPFESILFEQGKSFKINIPKTMPIRSDANAVRKIIEILMDNAAKYSENGGSVSVTLKRGKSETVLSIFNTGSYISSKEQKHIFDRFYRSDSSRDRKTGGYGLGLSIAKSLTDAIGARIEVKSDESHGTTFYVMFPKKLGLF